MIYRFDEDKILKEIGKYIEGTYSSHYVNEKAGTKDEEIQTIDVWKQMGHVAVSYTHLTLPTTPYV